MARSDGRYKAIMCVLGQLSEGKSKREQKECAVGEEQKLSTHRVIHWLVRGRSCPLIHWLVRGRSCPLIHRLVRGRKGAIHSEVKTSVTANPETAGYVQDIHSSNGMPAECSPSVNKGTPLSRRNAWR